MTQWQSSLENIPVGIYEKALPSDLSWPDRLLTARQAGYDFVEIAIDDTDRRIARLDWNPAERAALRAAVSETGVPTKSMSLSAHRRFPLGSASAATRRTALDILHKAIDLAVDIGLRYILVAGIDVYYEDSAPATRERYLDGLEQGFGWATAAGVMLALENWDIRVDSIADAMTYVEHFNSPWFQLYADIGNLAYAGHDVAAELALGKGHIAAVHVKDTLPGQLRYVPLGEGAVPFVDAFSRLAEIGFQGPVALELWTENDPAAIEIAVASRRWLKARMEQGWQAYFTRNPIEKGAFVES